MSRADELRKRMDAVLPQYEKEKREALEEEARKAIEWILDQFERKIEEGTPTNRIYFHHSYDSYKEQDYLWFRDEDNHNYYSYDFENYKSGFFATLRDLAEKEAGIRITFIDGFFAVDLV